MCCRHMLLCKHQCLSLGHLACATSAQLTPWPPLHHSVQAGLAVKPTLTSATFCRRQRGLLGPQHTSAMQARSPC